MAINVRNISVCMENPQIELTRDPDFRVVYKELKTSKEDNYKEYLVNVNFNIYLSELNFKTEYNEQRNS